MRLLGKYELLHSLAQTDLAERYLGRAPAPGGAGGSAVIIERLLPDLAHQPRVRAAFLREASRGARLRHANLLRVIEVCEAPDECFVVVEHLRGRDLATALAAAHEGGVPLPQPLAVFIVGCLCRALQPLHAAIAGEAPFGQAHAGIEPQQVLLGYAGEVKLGGAWLSAAAAAWAPPSTAVAGAGAAYASPEQWRRESLDGRSDVFALGTLLYELLARQPLFARATPTATREAVLAGPIPLLSDEVPAALAAVVASALHRDREQRYVSAQELGFALDQVVCTLRWSTDPPVLARWLSEVLPPTDAAMPPAEGAEPAPAPLAERSTVPWGDASPPAAEVAHDREEADTFLDEVPTVEATREVLAGLVHASSRRDVSKVGPAPAVAPAPLPPPPLPSPERQTTTDALPRARSALTGLWWSTGVLCTLALLAVGWRLWHGRGAAPVTTVLELDAVPVAARVYREGRQPVGDTPLVLGDLQPGVAHTLVFSAEGYRAATRVVRLRAGERLRVQVTLEPLRAAERFVLDVVTRPAGAALFVDGTRRGTTPLRLDDLRRGEAHSLRLRRQGYLDLTRSVDEREAARLGGVLDLELEALPPPPPPRPRRASGRPARTGIEIPRGRVETGLRPP